MKCKLRRALWALPCLPVDDAPEFFAGIVVCNWLVILSVCITLMCTFDPTGRTFVKLKATRRRQRNLTTYTLRYFWLFFNYYYYSSARGWGLPISSSPPFPSHKDFILHLLSVRHRLEEGQASSWSRRLKFFMCCTRAQDTQSVSHVTRSPVFPFVSEISADGDESIQRASH